MWGKKLKQCGDAEEYTFWAPNGFAYKWYWADDDSHAISTKQYVNVPVGGNRTLKCHLSFIGNPNCGFDLYSHTEYMYPLPWFSVMQEADCDHTYRFINQSAISNDGIHPNGSGELCENAFWDFGDGQTSYSISPTHTYSLPGDYSIILVAGIHGFDCTDTIRRSLAVLPNTVFDTLSCRSYLWNGVTYTETGTYYQSLTTIHGCDSLVAMNLTIDDGVTSHFEDMGCDEYVWNGIGYDASGQYQQLLQNQHGCDSLVTLDLDMEYYPGFRIAGDHYPIAGTEEAYTRYEYEIAFDNPSNRVDSVHWTLGNQCEGFDIQPADGGLKAYLYLYAYCLDSIEIKTRVYNRCGTEEHGFWFHTSYFGVGENGVQASFDIFPNPSGGELQLRFRDVDGAIDLKVYDHTGAVIVEKAIKPESTTQNVGIDLKGYPDGVYYIVANHGGRSFARKCVVSH